MKKLITRKLHINQILANATEVKAYDERNPQGVACHDRRAPRMDYENYDQAKVYALGNDQYMVRIHESLYYTLDGSDRCQGHIAFSGSFEYFTAPSGDLYRAPIANPLDIHGYRQGARFEATKVTASAALKLYGIQVS